MVTQPLQSGCEIFNFIFQNVGPKMFKVIAFRLKIVFFNRPSVRAAS